MQLKIKMMVYPIFFALFFGPAVFAKSLCIAHRGDHSLDTENSMAAIKKSVGLGVDGVEFDVRHTRDGIGIIMHDGDLKRTGASKKGQKCPDKNIDKLTYREIKDKCLLNNGEEIPLFKDVLSYLSETKVYIFIEFKDFPSFHSLQLIQEYLKDSPLRVRFISFKEKNLNQAYAYNNELPALSLMPAFHVYPFFKKKKNDYGIDVRFGAKRVRRALKHENVEIGVWTVNEPGDIMWSDIAGVKFITTNKPTLCMEITHHLRE